jgi:hypothetical protein
VSEVSRHRGIVRPNRRGGRLLAIAAVVLAAGASLALAEETTRADYKAAAEPICKANSEANEHILKGVRGKVKKGKLAPAGRQLIRAAAALRRTLVQLKAIPRPTADESRLAEWLKSVGEEAALLQQTGKALKAGKRNRAERLQAQLYSKARLANAIVLPFGFRYCLFEPSKYT